MTDFMGDSNELDLKTKALHYKFVQVKVFALCYISVSQFAIL